MIDMHSHFLWNVDDGPKTFEESIELLKQAAKEGITDLISTSHSQHPQYNAKFDTVNDQIQQLQIELTNRNIPLTLYRGHEVRLNEKLISLLQEGQIHKLANSNYVLLELPSSHVPNYAKNIIHQLSIQGLTAIIAHPERNKGIAEKPERLECLIREGAVAQITAGSLAGHFGKSVQKLSLDLVSANLVHTYGSDVHNLTTRPFLFEKGLAYLEKKKRLDAVDLLLKNNKSIIRNEPLVLFEPETVKKRKWLSL
ncbi:tyrosine-protein phosphatase [Ureibacillus sp. GCM10028918]|uniref:tyrosine-protein phosphatase n=1 Tax=Ureibacillus sp. GCM10028918 TaxID=3273429 RepID=UPI0036237EEB